MAKPRVRLGELLVEAGIVTGEQLDEVLAFQKRDGRRLGTLLVESGLVTETQVTQILSQQLSVPWVSLHHIEFSRTLLDLVPREVAEKYCLVPIFVRRVRGYGNTLYIAMDDPSDERAQGEVAEFSGLPVRSMIAPPSDIRSAIRVYYGGGEEEETAKVSESTPPPEAAEVMPVDAASATAAAEPAFAEASRETETAAEIDEAAGSEAPAPVVEASESAAMSSVEPAPPAAPAQASAEAFPASEPDSGPQIEAHEIELPRARRGKGRRMITLTLLDGTQINLPAHGERTVAGAQATDSSLTAGDLVLALRAVAHGADAKEILGETPKWETMFAALLSLLLKKHLIADWEFVDEYKKGAG